MGTFSGTKHLAPLVTPLEERWEGGGRGKERREGGLVVEEGRDGMKSQRRGRLCARDSLPPSQAAENLHFLSGRPHLAAKQMCGQARGWGGAEK